MSSGMTDQPRYWASIHVILGVCVIMALMMSTVTFSQLVKISCFEVEVGYEDAADALDRHIITATDIKYLQLTAFLCNDVQCLVGDEGAAEEVDDCHLVEVEAILVKDLSDMIVVSWILLVYWDWQKSSSMDPSSLSSMTLSIDHAMLAERGSYPRGSQQV